MKSAVNPPIDLPQWDLGSMSYGLAHEAVKSNKYLNRLKSLASWHRRYLILDNGADELTEGLRGQEYIDLLNEIEPQEFILPDVLQDGEETYKRSVQFIKELEVAGWIFDGDDRFQKVMAVAQGKTFTEWINCYTKFLSLPEVNIIGIPYDIDFDVNMSQTREMSKTEARALNRINLLQHLLAKGMLTKPIHLLGMNNLDEFRTLSAYSNVLNIRSNDTTAPFAAAMVGRKWVNGHSGEKDWPALHFGVAEKTFQADDRAFYAMWNLTAYFAAVNDLEALHNMHKTDWSKMIEGGFDV
ncbi:hypothetical protein [Streptomyces sp. CoH17]|uniref:hypothetical protein n=1 Tax=Streptomyces sp. CoH17 TaxID=2992806 RepID=UPI002270E160|nr:hypothetical protein [Streptomyces sp. CoH17]